MNLTSQKYLLISVANFLHMSSKYFCEEQTRKYFGENSVLVHNIALFWSDFLPWVVNFKPKLVTLVLPIVKFFRHEI